MFIVKEMIELVREKITKDANQDPELRFEAFRFIDALTTAKQHLNRTLASDSIWEDIKDNFLAISKNIDSPLNLITDLNRGSNIFTVLNSQPR